MNAKIITVDAGSFAITKFMRMFQFKEQADLFRNAMLDVMRDSWGDEFDNTQDGFIYGTVPIVECFQVTNNFKAIESDDLVLYIWGNVGDFSLYARLWDETPTEYILDVPFCIWIDEVGHWISFNFVLDGDFNITKARVAYDADDFDEALLLDMLNSE